MKGQSAILRLSIKQLEAFTSVVECGSFSRAAEELFLSQSTVSAHVSSLEKALGEPLLIRGERRPVELTAAGSRVYPLAKKILSDCGELQMLFQTGGEDTPLLLGASTVPGQYLLPGYLASFFRRCPHLRYKLQRGDSASIHRLIQNGDVRLGFVGARLEPEAYEYIPLARDTLVMVTQNNERYRRLRERGTLGKELLSEPTVAREEGSGTDRTIQNYMRAIGYPRDELRILARVDDPETIKRMVSEGMGVSVLSALAVEREVAEGKLLAFPMDPDGLHRDIFLIHRRDALLSTIERQFVDYLKKISDTDRPST